MQITKRIKKNNGSTLTLVLFMLFMLSVMAIAVITLTGSELSMSVMTTDRGNALMAAQAGAEKAAQVIDEAVAKAQEDARVLASNKVEEVIGDFKYTASDSRIPILSTSPFYKVIDNPMPDEIVVLNEEDLNKIYEGEYRYQFDVKIKEWIGKQIKAPSSGSLTECPLMKNKQNNITNDSSGVFSYTDISLGYSSAQIHKSITDKAIFSKYDPLDSIKIKTLGEHKSTSSGSNYRRNIEAKFSFATGSITDKDGNKTTEIPISYGKLTKVRVNEKKDLPSILSKALIAKKNIISIDGTVKVTGDTVCFGTMPTKVIGFGSDATSVIDYDANSYKFGGIMAGMVSSNNSSVYDIWNDTQKVYGTESLKNDMQQSLKYSDTFFKTNHAGSFIFNGNVGTMAYLNSLFSMDSNLVSEITVEGNIFARSVMVGSESNYSETQLNNVYTYDDLRIDGNNSKVKIGKWNNDNTPVRKTGLDTEGILVGLNDGNLFDKTSSAVIVAGDSYLNINGSVYVGGSTFYSDYINKDTTPNNNDKPYSSGMSIQKSDNRPAEAFEKNVDYDIDPSKYPGNVFYKYYNNINNGTYVNVSELNDTEKIVWAKYDKVRVPGTEMMEGSITPSKTSYFDIMEKAMHIKYIWDKFWKDPGYGSYINTGDIIIEPLDADGKIKGWCNGGVGANGKVYGPYGGFTYSDRANYAVEKDKGLNNYKEIMNLFINSDNDFTKPEPSNTKFDNSVNKLAWTAPSEIIKTKQSNLIVCFSTSNVVLDKRSIHNILTGQPFSDSEVNPDGYLKGIIYSEGDIYVGPGTKFKGVLIAEGNIVFIGDTTPSNQDNNIINIEYDKNVIDLVLNEELLAGRFFKHTVKDVIMNDQNALIQTIKKKGVKNIKIVSWKEV